VPIHPIALQTFNHEEARKFLQSTDFVKILEERNPGSSTTIREFGCNAEELGTLLGKEIPHLRSYPYNANGTKRAREANLLDILLNRLYFTLEMLVKT
jgi:hypothetical protein